MSRVVKLMPDKLATAIAINGENLADSKDDGKFLLDLVTKLIRFYRARWLDPGSKVLLTMKEDEEEQQPSGDQDYTGFVKSLDQLLEALAVFCDKLRERKISKEDAAEALAIGQDMLDVAHAYMDHVHPWFVAEMRRTPRKRLDEEFVYLTKDFALADVQAAAEKQAPRSEDTQVSKEGEKQGHELKKPKA